jgi:hypothetical protein
MKNSKCIIIIMFLFIVSCKEDESINHTNFLYKITETKIQEFTVEILSETEKLYTGFNNVVLKFKKGNKYINVELEKSMVFFDIGSLPHSTPREEKHITNYEYICPIVFIMPTKIGTHWYFDLQFKYKNNKYKGKLPFEVEENPNLQSFIYNEKTYFVSIVTPRNPFIADTGLNHYKLVVYERWNNIQFPPVNNLEVTITPILNNSDDSLNINEQLVSIGKGYYEGKVDFNVNGNWNVISKFSKDGNKIGEVKHSFTF